MGLANIGIPGLILIIVVALIIFGPKKLPEIGKAAGQTLGEFKHSANEIMSDDVSVSNNDENSQTSSND